MRALEDLCFAAEAIRRRELSSAELIEACLDRYRATEPMIHAFAWLDEDQARGLARERDAVRSDGSPRGLLHGVPVGVKDIFDTAGIPTENGSALFRGRVPARSSEVVRALEAAGAIVIGKTVTAELAFLTPGPTRNPYDLARTPGGSSMGSAAAVAAGVIPGAIGSQTNGSTIRPGAFSGAVGFKPTGGRISTAGALEFSKTLDQVGTFAGDVASVARLTAATSGDPLDEWWSGKAEGPPRLAAVRTADWEAADDAMQARFQADVDELASEGGPIEWPVLPDGLEEAPAFIQTVMAYESARTLGPLAAARPHDVSERAHTFFARGREISTEEYERTIRERLRLIAAFNEWAAPYEAILTIPATGEAPTPETTGDPRFCSRWTFVGAPALVIPTGLGPSGLPLGLQLVGARGSDKRLLAAAARAESLLPAPPAPALVTR
ncbi:MAG TPA: amidase [Chloroflexi bacterium]|jgi:Asp-tRNA(Asn)/Glu-tRNA(Gln) amidotransferase A subunit family amidase|nr:amidase [Chloroflexota bacterium]HAL26908.1 amidase [Chloroflexota bacterium]